MASWYGYTLGNADRRATRLHWTPPDCHKKLLGKPLVEFHEVSLEIFTEEFLEQSFDIIAGKISGGIPAEILLENVSEKIRG